MHLALYESLSQALAEGPGWSYLGGVSGVWWVVCGVGGWCVSGWYVTWVVLLSYPATACVTTDDDHAPLTTHHTSHTPHTTHHTPHTMHTTHSSATCSTRDEIDLLELMIDRWIDRWIDG